MHTVTKILVVFAAILAVLLAALTMAYSVNAARIVADYRAAKDDANAARTTNSQQFAEWNLKSAEQEKRYTDAEKRIADIEGQIRGLQTDNGRMMADKRAVEADRDAIRAQIGQIGSANETLANLNRIQRDEVSKLRENELAYKRKEIELTDRINDLDSQLEVSQASVRALQETLVETQRNMQTAGGVQSGDRVAQPGEAYAPSFQVSGKVKRVAKDVSGKTMATINLGTNNQVRDNMKLSIVRGDTFIGNLKIVKADLQESIGEITILSGNNQVQVNDEVRSLLASR